jgi:hypothetical protein
MRDPEEFLTSPLLVPPKGELDLAFAGFMLFLTALGMTNPSISMDKSFEHVRLYCDQLQRSNLLFQCPETDSKRLPIVVMGETVLTRTMHEQNLIEYVKKAILGVNNTSDDHT